MKKTIGMILILVAVFIGLFLFFRFGIGGSEDFWICENSAWVEHGNPSDPMPLVPCEKDGQASDKISPVRELVKVSFEDSKKIAENFARNSSTYKFDGMDLKFVSYDTLRCPYCWKFNFTYNSRHSGWGDRKDLILAQVITPHELAITVVEGKVAAAVADGTFDEIGLKYIK